MHGDEGFEIAVAHDEVHNVFHFHLRVGKGPMVRFGTGVLAGPGTWQNMSTVTVYGVLLQQDNDDIYIPPKPASQFLLGSTPRQEEPEFTERVLRHIRF